jgi:simple sugar transport system substrate-binding protein
LSFAGPLKDNAGTLKVSAGKSLTVDELVALNWFVEGVAGSLPK